MSKVFCVYLMLSLAFFIYAQEPISKKEEYFISRQIPNKPVVPMDNQLGIMENNIEISNLIEDFIFNGPRVKNSLESMIPILGEKYAPLRNKTAELIRISKNSITDNRYEGDIRIISEGENILCSIYLLRLEDKWYIEDFQIN
jgi:hypothetical protein